MRASSARVLYRVGMQVEVWPGLLGGHGATALGMAVTGLPALSAAHGVLSVTLVVVQRPIRPVSAPVPCRVGSQMEVRQGVLGGHGTTVLGTDVEPIGTPMLGGVPVKDSAAVKSMRAVILPLTTSWLRT